MLDLWMDYDVEILGGMCSSYTSLDAMMALWPSEESAEHSLAPWTVCADQKHEKPNHSSSALLAQLIYSS